jgi:hypothetical protein
MTAASITKLPPSLLSKKILCSAYLPAPFDSEARSRFQAYHSFALVKVIKRHLKLGFTLRGIEVRNGDGYRNDVVFTGPDGKLRTVEVKSAKQLTEVHRIQGALYWSSNAGEIVVSNANEDIILTQEYINDVQNKAQLTRTLLTQRPDIASSTFNPQPEICRICANMPCPFHSKIIVGR